MQGLRLVFIISGKETMNVDDIIKERQKTHGNYKDQAATAQAFKIIMRSTPNWQKLKPEQKESLELIATKISRMCHGDPTHEDNAVDIAGYAKLMF